MTVVTIDHAGDGSHREDGVSIEYESDASSVSRRLELYVRSLAPSSARDHQESVVTRVQALADSDAVDTTRLHITGDCVCPSAATARTERGRFLLDRVALFESWAATEDVELVGFERRDGASMTGEAITGIRFPRIVLAAFADDELEFVAPCRGTSVSDFLDSLEARLL